MEYQEWCVRFGRPLSEQGKRVQRDLDAFDKHKTEAQATKLQTHGKGSAHDRNA